MNVLFRLFGFGLLALAVLSGSAPAAGPLGTGAETPAIELAPKMNDEASYHPAGWTPTSPEIRKKIYLFTTDFPADPLAQYPTPPAQTTRFWRLLDKNMTSTDDLMLTPDPGAADYRVELRCAGLFQCSRLIVDVRSPQRNLLTSFSLKNVNRLWGLGPARLEPVSRELTMRLDEHIRALPRGGYGYTDK